MNIEQFDINEPIIIGLAGKAGSGKTSVAEQIVPKGSLEITREGIKWDHIFYALPLYEMSSIRRTIKGINENNRQLYAIHEALYDVYGSNPLGNIPSYEDFVSRVFEIKNLFIEPEGVKPRSFLQKAGDICRKDFEDCFAKWGVSKSFSLYREYIKKTSEDERTPYAVIISDVRFVNEAEAILKQKNGVVVCFDASQETLQDRILKRDGKFMDPILASHRSEQEIEAVKSISSLVINTDNMSIEDQTYATMSSLGLGKLTNA
jgi:cytidylate kinase